MLARGHEVDFVLDLDLRSFNELVASADRNHRQHLRESVVMQQHAAQGGKEDIEKLFKRLDQIDAPEKVVQRDQAAFIRRMGRK